MNQAQPEFLSTLVLEFPLGSERFEKPFNGDWHFPTKLNYFKR